MKTKQITRPVTGRDGLVYSFLGRYATKEQARMVCLELTNTHKYTHVYYCRIIEKGITYYDVRISNK